MVSQDATRPMTLSIEDLRHIRGLLAAWEDYQQQAERYRNSHDRLMRHLIPVLRRLQHVASE